MAGEQTGRAAGFAANLRHDDAVDIARDILELSLDAVDELLGAAAKLVLLRGVSLHCIYDPGFSLRIARGRVNGRASERARGVPEAATRQLLREQPWSEPNCSIATVNCRWRDLFLG